MRTRRRSAHVLLEPLGTAPFPGRPAASPAAVWSAPRPERFRGLACYTGAVTGRRERKKYRNPPIEEALVEFQMVPGQEWDLTIPGKLHEKVKTAYPGKPRQQKLLQAAVRAAPGQPPDFALHEGIGRVQLIDAEAKRLLSLGPDVLSVNVLRPYDGREKFKPRIDEALRAYSEVAGADKVRRIGVRYVNKVVIHADDVALGQFFLCGPPIPEGLPKTMAAFVNRAEHVFDDGVKLILTFATVEAEKGSSAFLLDLDVIWESAEGVEMEQALKKVDDLHEREGIAFESVITDDTRKVFDED